MSESTRPSINAVRRTLIVGVLAGLVLGCIFGLVLGLIYAWQIDPATYAGGARPDEMTKNYQDHYIAMVIDSYAVNRDISLAQKRLQSFDQATKIRALGQWSAAYSTAGRGPEAQAVNELAVNLKQAEQWDPNVISTEMGQLATAAQGDSARLQAINAYGAVLDVVPQQTAAPIDQPAQQPTAAATVAPPTPPQEEGMSWPMMAGICLLVLLVVVAIVLLLGMMPGFIIDLAREGLLSLAFIGG
jgi:hypothetical protein